ncbi:YHYH domain-containing protein [bacterium]|nr:YHYH domain-containing protein [bacterium]
MNRYIVIGLCIIAFSAIASGLVVDHSHEEGTLEHSGGTDSNGCHTNSKTGDYHCHNRK